MSRRSRRTSTRPSIPIRPPSAQLRQKDTLSSVASAPEVGDVPVEDSTTASSVPPLIPPEPIEAPLLAEPEPTQAPSEESAHESRRKRMATRISPRPMRSRSSATSEHVVSRASQILPPLAPIAPGVGRGAVLSAGEVARHMHAQRRQRERARLQRIVFFSLLILLVAFVFVGTAGWEYKRVVATMDAEAASFRAHGPTPPPAEMPSPQTLQALQELDRAVTEKRRRNYDAATISTTRALKLDPNLKGTGTTFAELAFYRNDESAITRITRESIEKNDLPADAYLLQAIGTWYSRMLPGAKSAGELSKAAFDAIDKSIAARTSSFEPFLLRADIERELGRPNDANDSIHSALHRIEPWASTTYLDTKLQLAEDQAGSAFPATPAARAAVALRHAVRDKDGSAQTQINKLRSHLTEHQFNALIQDPAFLEK